jgi:hypothetical protein
MKLLPVVTCASLVLLSTQISAQTLIEGVYMSPSGDNGRGSCTLEIRSAGKSPKYGDDIYALTSTGEGACEWTAVGLAKNFAISAGMVNSGGHSGYVNVKWPFGPGGGKLELSAYDTDGSVRSTLQFTRADSK